MQLITESTERVPAFARVAQMAKELTNDAGFPVQNKIPFQGTVNDALALGLPQGALPPRVTGTAARMASLVPEARIAQQRAMALPIEFTRTGKFSGTVGDLADSGLPLDLVPAVLRPTIQSIRGGTSRSPLVRANPVPNFEYQQPFAGTLAEAASIPRAELPAAAIRRLDRVGRMVDNAQAATEKAGRAPISFEYDGPFTPNMVFIDNLQKVGRARVSSLFEGLGAGAGQQARAINRQILDHLEAQPQFGPRFADIQRRYSEGLRVAEQMEINAGAAPIEEGLYVGNLKVRQPRLQSEPALSTPASRGVADVLEPATGFGQLGAAGRAGLAIDAVRRASVNLRRRTTDEAANLLLSRGNQATDFFRGLQAATQSARFRPPPGPSARAAGFLGPFATANDPTKDPYP